MKEFNVLVIGLGYVGLPLAENIAAEGFSVTGFDIDKEKILKLSKRKSLVSKIKYSELNFVDRIEKDKKFKYIIICVPTPLLKSGAPDLKPLNLAFSYALKHSESNSLLIIESTVGPGDIRRTYNKFRKVADHASMSQVAFSPERIDPLNKKWDVKNTPKLVAGLTEKARDRAVEFYSKFIDIVIPCSSLEIAETAKLLENSFRLINISFINELAIFCNKIGIDVQEVIKAASTKPYGFMPFYPSVGIGGHCIPVDPVYLSHKAKEVGAPTSFIDLATKVNHEMPKYFAKRASQMLGKVKNKKVLVLGVSYKPNISDVRETPVEALIDGLRKKGAKVKWHDDIVKKWRGEKSTEITDKYDLAIIATPHDYFDLKKLGKTKILNTRSSI
jgi:UDP-N-acetyl-D-glucosamine dehydrogenase